MYVYTYGYIDKDGTTRIVSQLVFACIFEARNWKPGTWALEKMRSKEVSEICIFDIKLHKSIMIVLFPLMGEQVLKVQEKKLWASFWKGIGRRFLTKVFLKLWTFYPIYPGSRFATTPPPSPPMVWSQNLRFAAFCMKALDLQCFLHGGWLARSANLQIHMISCNQPSDNVLFAFICNVSASTSWSSAVAPASMSNNHIILNLHITLPSA